MVLFQWGKCHKKDTVFAELNNVSIRCSFVASCFKAIAWHGRLNEDSVIPPAEATNSLQPYRANARTF